MPRRPTMDTFTPELRGIVRGRKAERAEYWGDNLNQFYNPADRAEEARIMQRYGAPGRDNSELEDRLSSLRSNVRGRTLTERGLERVLPDALAAQYGVDLPGYRSQRIARDRSLAPTPTMSQDTEGWNYGGGPAPAPGIVPGVGQRVYAGPMDTPGGRPWYMDYDNAVLMEMLKRDPTLAPTLPQEVWEGFENQFYLDHPAYVSNLSPERIKGEGQWAGTGFAGHLQAGMLAQIPQKDIKLYPPGTPYPKNPFDTSVQPVSGKGVFGGDPNQSTGGNTAPIWWGDGPEPIGYRKPNIYELQKKLQGTGSDLVPAISAPLTGVQLPTYRSQGGMPNLTPQYRNLMSPAEREVWGVTVNKTGGRAEDAFEYGGNLGRMAAPQATGYRSAPGPRVRGY